MKIQRNDEKSIRRRLDKHYKRIKLILISAYLLFILLLVFLVFESYDYVGALLKSVYLVLILLFVNESGNYIYLRKLAEQNKIEHTHGTKNIKPGLTVVIITALVLLIFLIPLAVMYVATPFFE